MASHSDSKSTTVVILGISIQFGVAHLTFGCSSSIGNFTWIAKVLLKFSG